MASETRGRKRDSLLNPLNWVKRSRSSSSAAKEGPSTTTSQPDNTLRLNVTLRHTSHQLSTSQSLSPSVHPQLSPHPTIATPEPQVVPDASKSPPSQSLDLWSQAFRNANDTTQEWLKEIGLDIHSSDKLQTQTQIKDVISLIKSKELPADVGKTLTFTIANRKISVREYVENAIAFVTMAGDAAMVFAPPQASAPWAVARAVMKVCQFFYSKDALMESDDQTGYAHLATPISSL
jgi:hypothetical protein